MSKARTLWLLSDPRLRAPHLCLGVGMPFWVLALAFPPSLGSVSAYQQLAEKRCNGLLSLFMSCRYSGTIAWHRVLARLVTEGMGHGQGKPWGWKRQCSVGDQPYSGRQVSVWGWAAQGHLRWLSEHFTTILFSSIPLLREPLRNWGLAMLFLGAKGLCNTMAGKGQMAGRSMPATHSHSELQC